MAKARGRDDPLLVALMDDVIRVRAEGRVARRLANPRERQQLHARLAEAMEAYADAAATVGIPLSHRFRSEMRDHRSRAGDVRTTPT